MDFGLLFFTFISVNLDFFFMLIFLLKKYRLGNVIIGYLLGVLFLVTVSYVIGIPLKMLLPEWALGILGFLPIYMAFRKECDDRHKKKSHSEIWNTFITYLSVCTGCNLSIFLPVLVKENFGQFLGTLMFIGILTALAVVLIKLLINNDIVDRIMAKYGDLLTKICYVTIGIYIFFESGLISHLIHLL